MKNYKIYQLVLLLTPFVFSFAFGLDIYIPIVPTMADTFNTSPALIQLTLSLFLFITGVGQLFIGPLSDQFGRKTIFYLSAACYAVGSLICAFSTDITGLIFGRVISAIGACGLLVTSFALVRDLYSSEDSAKIYSFFNGTIGISPTFAPIIGGYLAVYFGWQSIFIFLTIIGIFSYWVIHRFITETHPKEKRVKINLAVFKRYGTIFAHPQLLLNSIISGCGESVFFCFFSISPFIIIDLHGVPVQEFGYYFAVFGAVIAVGGLTSGWIIEKLGIAATMAIGIALMMIGGLSMLVWHYFYEISLSGFLIPMALACTGSVFLVGGAASRALEPFGRVAGTAAAAFGALEFAIAAIVGSLLMLFPTTSAVPYGIFIVLLGGVALSMFIISTWSSPIRHQDSSSDTAS
jgi:Bcr/CflA subfamily drug resistance transporter